LNTLHFTCKVQENYEEGKFELENKVNKKMCGDDNNSVTNEMPKIMNMFKLFVLIYRKSLTVEPGLLKPSDSAPVSIDLVALSVSKRLRCFVLRATWEENQPIFVSRGK
jgi:hypothetical protein